MASAFGIPIRSDTLVMPRPATGINPTKLNMNTAESVFELVGGVISLVLWARSK